MTQRIDEGYLITEYDSGATSKELHSEVTQQMQRRAQILAQLATIDAQTTKPRTVRELALGNTDALAWVRTQNAQAATLRAELAAL